MINDETALRMASEAYDGSTTYFDANIRLRIEQDIRRFQSKFPSGSKYMSDGYKARSRIFRPKTRATIRKGEAVAAEAFFSTLDMVSITPTDESDKLKAASAELMSSILQHRLTKSIKWFLTCIGGYQDAMTTGVVISHQYWKYNPKKKKDEPAIELLPIENFRFDPAAAWYDPVGTSPYLIQMIPMYLKDIKARMGSKRWMELTEAEIRAACMSYDPTRMVREDNRTDSKQEAAAITDYSVAWVHRNIVEIDGEDMIYYTLGSTKLLTRPVPLETEYAADVRPYVVGQCVIETHKIYPGGSSSLGAGIQDEINEVTNQRLDNVKFVLNKRYFVKRNRQVDLRSLTRNSPGAVTLMTDPEGDVEVVSTPDVTSSSYNEQDRLNMDYDDVAGVFSGSSVASNRKLNETVGGMNILTTNSNQVQAYQLKTFVETWVEPVLRQLMLLEQYYETDDVLVALCAGKAQLWQRFGVDQITDEMLEEELTLNCNVGMGATNPQDKVNTLAMGMGAIKTILTDGLLEKYGLQPQELIKEILGALGHKDGGRFFDFKNGDDPRIAVLQQQLSELQAALDAKNPPEIVAATVKKLDAETKFIESNRVKSGVEGAYSAMQAAQVVAATPAVSPIADSIMQMSGYTTPNPAGIDPNFPVPAQPAPELTGYPEETSSTNPLTPAPPASPFVGQEAGIETQAPDGVIQ